MVFGGLVLGSILATLVFNKWKYKQILTVSYLGNAIGLIIVSQTQNYYLVVFGRFLSGFNQILHQVYVPVFVDAFGTSNAHKSFWMSFMLLCCPMGVIIGYEMTAVSMNYSTWQQSFVIEACVSMACFVIIIGIPSKYIEIYDIVMVMK